MEIIEGCDPLIRSTEVLPSLLIDQLQDYYRRLYSSGIHARHTVEDDESRKEIQKLRKQIETISKKMENESTKNLRQYTISSLSKINSKLRLIEQKLDRSLPHSNKSTKDMAKIYKIDQKGQFIP
jgi:hypothetical protein